MLLRTPPDGASYAFAGDSLTITGSGLATGVNNEALMWKGTGTASTITVADLTIDGGQLRHGQGDADSFTLAGNLTIGANGANFATQGGMTISANLSGTTTIRVLDSGNTDARRLITCRATHRIQEVHTLLLHERWDQIHVALGEPDVL